MHFTDLTTHNEHRYTLDQSDKHVFFLFNQSGDFSFELNTPDTEAYIFALFTGTQATAATVKINQLHNASRTTSHVLVHYLGQAASSLHYEGLIRIAQEASQSVASQRNTNLLLSDQSSAFSFPSLEILTDDVICHHGSTTSRINKDHLFYAESRGISPVDAEHMLAAGFVQSFFDTIEKLGSFPELEKYKESFLM